MPILNKVRIVEDWEKCPKGVDPKLWNHYYKPCGDLIIKLDQIEAKKIRAWDNYKSIDRQAISLSKQFKSSKSVLLNIRKMLEDELQEKDNTK